MKNDTLRIKSAELLSVLQFESMSDDVLNEACTPKDAFEAVLRMKRLLTKKEIKIVETALQVM